MYPTIPGVYLNSTNSGVTTGSFQEVFLPSTLIADALSVNIQVHNGDAEDFTSFLASPPVFHYSKTGDENDKDFFQHVRGFAFDISTVAGASIGFVRAEAGQYVVIQVLS